MSQDTSWSANAPSRNREISKSAIVVGVLSLGLFLTAGAVGVALLASGFTGGNAFEKVAISGVFGTSALGFYTMVFGFVTASIYERRKRSGND